MTYVVDNTVDEQILLNSGVPQDQIQYLGHDSRAGTGDYTAPTNLATYSGDPSAVFVGHAGTEAGKGAATLIGQDRGQTAQLVQSYVASNPPASTWGGAQQSAYDLLNSQLEQWGITGLGDTIKSLLTQGLSSDAVMVELENSDAFKQRFAGNQERIAKGLAVLSPAEYIATERSYDQVLRQYGINTTFSTRDNFAKWIGNDVSSTELQSRAQEGSDLVQQTDPTARNLLNQWYGITHSDIMSTFLDPEQAQTTLDKKSYAANVGAAMSRYGLGANQQSAEGLYGTVSQQQAVAGLQNAGQTFKQTQTLAQRYGAQYSAQDAINQYVLGQEQPALIQQQLSQKEDAQFARGSAFNTNGAGVSSGAF